MINKSCFFLSLLLFISTFCNSQPKEVPDSIYPKIKLLIPYLSDWAKAHYYNRIDEFKKDPLEVNDIVFLGNSITEQGGDWGRRFNIKKIKNRGIAGDLTIGVLNRLGEIYYSKPAAIFILIGINDLYSAGMPVDYVSKNIIEIARSIHNKCPLTKIYVQTILPTSNILFVAKIKETNNILLGKSSLNFFSLINIHNLFADKNDLMKNEYTTDGVHLNEAGYNVWVNYLVELNKNGGLIKKSFLKSIK